MVCKFLINFLFFSNIWQLFLSMVVVGFSATLCWETASIFKCICFSVHASKPLRRVEISEAFLGVVLDWYRGNTETSRNLINDKRDNPTRDFGFSLVLYFTCTFWFDSCLLLSTFLSTFRVCSIRGDSRSLHFLYATNVFLPQNFIHEKPRGFGSSPLQNCSFWRKCPKKSDLLKKYTTKYLTVTHIYISTVFTI